MINVQDIESANWSLKLDGAAEGDGLGSVVQGFDDVAQCLTIICTTPKGTDPLRPLFAIDITSFIDLPLTRAIPVIVREMADAITNYEPRIVLIGITAAPVLDGPQAGAQVRVTIAWRLRLDADLNGQPVTRTTAVLIPWSFA